jgi:hypothetical protein
MPARPRGWRSTYSKRLASDAARRRSSELTAPRQAPPQGTEDDFRYQPIVSGCLHQAAILLQAASTVTGDCRFDHRNPVARELASANSALVRSTYPVTLRRRPGQKRSRRPGRSPMPRRAPSLQGSRQRHPHAARRVRGAQAAGGTAKRRSWASWLVRRQSQSLAPRIIDLRGHD